MNPQMRQLPTREQQHQDMQRAINFSRAHYTKMCRIADADKLLEEYNLIQKKASKLSSMKRKAVVKLFELAALEKQIKEDYAKSKEEDKTEEVLQEATAG